MSQIPIPTPLREGRSAQPSRINEREPQPPARAPVMPDWLSEPAQQVWKRAVRNLRAMGTLASTDGNELGIYCTAVVFTQRAAQIVDASNVVLFRNTSGGGRNVMVANPASREFRENAKVVDRFSTKFGFTPSDRTKIETFEEDLGDPLQPDDRVDADVLSFVEKVKARARREGQGQGPT